MDNKEFNNLLVKYNLLSLSSTKMVEFLDSTYSINNNDVLNLISIIFSFSYLGHCYTPLNNLKDKYKIILDCKEIQENELNDESISKDFDNLKESLNSIKDSIESFKTYSEILGDDKLFIIDPNDSNIVFINKYYYASIGIKESFKRIFSNNNFESSSYDNSFINLKLKNEQEDAIKKGLSQNLLITGGPGTGKTSTIVFLLLNLLKDKTKNELDKYEIHLTAPSGKAAVRMSESIKSSLNGINKDNNKSIIDEDFKENHKDLIKKLESLNGLTIDKLLGYTQNGYRYNSNRLISSNNKINIFIIDEASMIDILKFNSLLNAIPEGSRVFILGDKDQLPSVQNGAVFNDLLKSKCKVELVESNRFKRDTDVYKLSRYINCNIDNYDFDFNKIDEFKIEDLNNCEVRFFDDTNCTKDDINKVVKVWYEKYIKSINESEKELVLKDDKLDINKLNKLNSYITKSKILSINNNGSRGVNRINKYIKEELFKEKKNDYFHGQMLMITQNIDSLDLKNGDNGICVKLNNSYYFMINKSYDNIIEGYQEIGIFKLNGFVFYPISLIKKEYITMAYAITIHKSQGSEYDNVLIILPESSNNKLLTRQIVYTAITRTKNSCYIVSNEDTLNSAKNNLEERLTKIF